jgi:hypothetical protein
MIVKDALLQLPAFRRIWVDCKLFLKSLGCGGRNCHRVWRIKMERAHLSAATERHSIPAATCFFLLKMRMIFTNYHVTYKVPTNFTGDKL